LLRIQRKKTQATNLYESWQQRVDRVYFEASEAKRKSQENLVLSNKDIQMKENEKEDIESSQFCVQKLMKNAEDFK